MSWLVAKFAHERRRQEEETTSNNIVPRGVVYEVGLVWADGSLKKNPNKNSV